MKLASTASLAALLFALSFALAPAASAQMRGAGPRMDSPPRMPGPSIPAPSASHPARRAAAPQNGRPADAPAIHAAVQQPGGQAALVVPARSSSGLVQPGGGAIPATSITTSGPGAPNEMLPGALPGQLPAPRQPLSDAVRLRSTVRITIRAISAARATTGLEIDGRLSPIDRDLRSFADQFSYRNYRLLDVQTFDLDFRSAAQMELPGRRAIEVEPRELAPDGRVKVHLELLGQHPEHTPRMRTDYSIPRGRTILVGGYRIDPDAPERGMLLLAITQDE